MVTQFMNVIEMVEREAGVCAYVRNDITGQIVYPRKLTDNNVEMLWICCCNERKSYYIACCYHPPKPSNPVQLFVDSLNKDIEDIISTIKDEIILIAGDFDKLYATSLCHDFGLVSIVDEPTHCSNILDQVFVNQPGVYKSLVFKSLLKRKHMAVLVTDKLTSNCNDASSNCNAASKRVKINIYDLHPHHIDRLRYFWYPKLE